MHFESTHFIMSAAETLADIWGSKLNNQKPSSFVASFYPTLENLGYSTHHEGLRIAHLNIRSLNAHFTELMLTPYSQFDVLAISETNISTSEEDEGIFNYDIPGYKYFSKARRNRDKECGGGVCIYVKSNIIANEVVALRKLNLEAIWVRLDIQGNKKVCIGCVYRPPDSDKDLFSLELSKFFSSRYYNDKCILLGDFNYNTLCAKPSPAQRNFFKKMEDLGFDQIIKKPTRITLTSETIIDHIYVPSDIVATNTNVVYIDISDHFLVSTIIRLKPVKAPKILIRKRNTNKLNPEDFYQYMSSLPLENSIKCDQLDDKVASLTANILKGLDAYAPYKTIRVRATQKPWIDRNLIKLSNYKNSMFRKAVNPNDNYSWNEYQILRNDVHNIFRNAKRNYYRTKVSRMPQNSHEIHTIFKELLPRSRAVPIEKVTVNENEITNSTEIAQKFNSFFANIGKEINSELEPIRNRNRNLDLVNLMENARHDHIHQPLTLNPVEDSDIAKMLQKLDIKKSSGPDGIGNDILKLLAPLITNSLTDIINTSIKTGKFPTDWKRASILPIFKSGEKDELGNYRPIALTNTLSRVLEKCVSLQITSHVEKNDFISKNQHGFRNRHSTENVLLDLFNHWYIILDNKTGDRYILATSLDVKKAFDSVNHNILLEKLENQFYFGEEALLWSKSFLNDRIIQTKVNGILSEQAIVNTGVPQGSLTGPQYFLFHTNDVNDIPTETVKKQFADDSIKSAQGDSPFAAVECMNRNIIPIQDWYIENLLMINSGKTKSLILSTTNIDTNTLPKVIVNGLETKYVPTLKHLGITIDSKLSLKTHVDIMERKVISKIKTFQKIRQFLDVKASKTFYLSYIRPHMEYCPTLLSSMNKTLSDSVEKLQNWALRIILQRNFWDSATEMRKDLTIPTLASRREVFLLTKVFDILHGNIPSLEYTKFEFRNTDRNLRSKSKFNLVVPKTNKTFFGRKSFNYLGAFTWNQLPVNIKSLNGNSRTKFINSIKKLRLKY